MTAAFAETHRNIEFSNNVTATLRETPGMLYPLAGSTANYNGNAKARIENRFGRLAMQAKTTRNGDTENADIDSVARWIAPGPLHYVAPMLDREDQQNTKVELNSPLVKEVAEAAATYHDDVFMAAFFGNAYSGELGDTAIPFKSANIIAHGGTGLTKNKLLALRELMAARHVRMMREAPIILLQPQDATDLFQIDEYVNSRYGDGRPLDTGELKPWLGFRFKEITPDAESLPTSYSSFFADAGVTRQNPVFVRSGMHRGVWVEFWSSIDDRADKQHSTQFYGEARSAGARTDEDKAFILQTQ